MNSTLMCWIGLIQKTSIPPPCWGKRNSSGFEFLKIPMEGKKNGKFQGGGESFDGIPGVFSV